VSPLARDEASRQRSQRHLRLCLPSWRVESVTDEVHQIARATRIRRSLADAGAELPVPVPAAPVESDDPTRALLPATPGHRADAGAAWGALIHGLLEHTMTHPEAPREDLERLARWLLLEHPDLRPFVPDAIECVAAVMRAPFWIDAASSGSCQVEVPFAIRFGARDESLPALSRREGLPRQPSLFDEVPASPPDISARDAADPPLILRGVIDLVHHTPDGWHIVDYKTDQVVAAADELVARYGGQVARYREAWTRATGAPVTGAALFSVRRLEVVPVPVGEARSDPDLA
jgi:ATP-dependent exoDNAse (exonuclease V) beta subunit